MIPLGTFELLHSSTSIDDNVRSFSYRTFTIATFFYSGKACSLKTSSPVSAIIGMGSNNPTESFRIPKRNYRDNNDDLKAKMAFENSQVETDGAQGEGGLERLARSLEKCEHIATEGVDTETQSLVENRRHEKHSHGENMLKDDRERKRHRRSSQWDVRKLPWEQSERDPNVNRSAYSVGGLDFSALSQYMIPVAPTTQPNTQQATKHARRLYVGNLPSDVTESEVADFFNSALYLAKGVDVPGDPVQSVYLNLDKRFAFIELNSAAEAAAAIQMDGVLFRGMSLRMRRPNDYNPNIHAPVYPPIGFDPSALGVVSTQVPDGPDKVFIGGLPYHLTEDQIKEILSSYGPLNAFNLVKDPNTGLSKGYAFFQYKDPSIVEAAIKGLNGMTMGDKTLTVRRASQVSSGSVELGQSFSPTVRYPTRILELRNMVEPEELVDDEEYEDIIEDVREESSKYGEVTEVKIPRPSKTDEANPPGLGKVFVSFKTVSDAEKAFAALTGRRFGGKSVIANYYDEERYYSGIL
ncbi:U2 snRNP auxiliary factor large subunit, putative isoform 1 [Galdieria sulphuraria]|uniref:Splicing factor U2AF subunit n=1 Tax=Galdieria sulphuraria TaxID=130081 RepID=M2Y411_GALSU|nr:U2 snRNP auxiliary factor large subunit, putative isoform 1 [Galdieria sulphuraria]EME30564.1 U2 snRNP auxiliary factor large subunit, putative isoform 1 [Galdieria sulphuraria]|eukprot:XP_005707084.1 U2 snRNP auxiliary factor large subunit, putative isoform 1 [Galdieria sulphuraria]